MDNEEMLEKLRVIFVQQFGSAAAHVDPSTMMKQIPGWDSASHIDLILAVEDAFKVEFSNDELANSDGVGAILELLSQKERG